MLKIDFINVGYGDCILLRDYQPDGTLFTVLVDTGDSVRHVGPLHPTRTTPEEFLQNVGIHTIDLLIITHLHMDHAGGMPFILEHFDVKELVSLYLPSQSFAPFPSEALDACVSGVRNLANSINIYLRAIETLRARQAVLTNAVASRQLTPLLSLSTIPGLGATAAWQQALLDELLSQDFSSDTARRLGELEAVVNNISIVSLFTYGSRRILLPGDVYLNFWETHAPISADIFKLPHHGHPDAANSMLAKAVNPAYAVICVSNDRPDDCPSLRAITSFDACSPRPRLLITDALAVSGYCTANIHQSVSFDLFENGALRLQA